MWWWLLLLASVTLTVIVSGSFCYANKIDHIFQIVSLEILSGLCLLSDGHRRVLKALASASELIGERTRFQRLIDDLWRPYRTSREEIRVKTAIMSLVNALMKTGAAENSLEFRLHLRYEMLMLGMQEVVDRLRRVDAPILHDHLDLFEMMRQEDEQELASSVDSGASSPVDYENPSAIADMIAHRLGDSVALPHFIALMQHLLMVPGMYVVSY
jgi:dishevelled associated activator of morphogenesis